MFSSLRNSNRKIIMYEKDVEACRVYQSLETRFQGTGILYRRGVKRPWKFEEFSGLRPKEARSETMSEESEYIMSKPMNAYTGFARVYETFMDNIPYKEWAVYLKELLSEYGVPSGSLLAELGCGTGSMTRLLAEAGYDMIGIDLSEEMLDIARYEHPEEEYDILYLNQDMREFELYGTVAAVISVCDSMNYITSEEELLQVFKLVNNYLDPGGYFIFDMKTAYNYEVLMGDRVIAENREDCSLIWENYFDKETGINQYDITIYTKAEFEEEETDEWEEEDAEQESLPPLYERLEESHIQRAYPVETVISLLKEAGLEFVAVYGGCTKEAPKADSDRVYFVAREKFQENKYYEEKGE